MPPLTGRAGRAGTVRRKWRPSLAMLIGALCVLLVALPVIAVLAARLVDGQLVRETETSLQAQAALLAAVYAEAIGPDPGFGRALDPEHVERRAARFDPALPRLSGGFELLDPLPEPPSGHGRMAKRRAAEADPLPAPPSAAPASPSPARGDRTRAVRYDRAAARLDAVARTAKRRTLAGYVATDADGRVIASSGTLSGDLGHVPEIRAALDGEDVATLRRRGDDPGRHPLTAVSRNTGYRVFVAQPVVAGDRLVGAVLVSRTPTDLGRFLYRERATVLRVGLVMALGAGLAGWLSWRLISRPVRRIAAQSQAVADRTRPMPDALNHYGVRELAGLGESVLSMARALDERAGMVETYTAHVTHELKSPTTAILGAAEMLRDAGAMASERRLRLISTIHAQARRMTALLERLRTLTRARLADRDRAVALDAAAAALRATDPGLAVEVEAAPGAMLPLSREQAAMALGQLAANARQHGARRLRLVHDADGPRLDVVDDGTGIDPTDRARVLEPFFTTRRAEGGTGMGLAIVAAIAEASGGRLALLEGTAGARFRLDWGAAGAAQRRDACVLPGDRRTPPWR